jgi:hypothetical protein
VLLSALSRLTAAEARASFQTRPDAAERRPCALGRRILMYDAFIIETATHTAGLAVREDRGFRFYASDSRFYPIDNRVFGGLRAIHSAVDSLLSAERAAPSGAAGLHRVGRAA